MSAVVEPARPLGLSPLLDHIRTAYSLAGVELTMELGGDGHFDALVTTGYGMFIVRVHPAAMNLDRLLAIQAARKALAAGGVPSTVVRATRTGDSWTRFEGQLVELGAYVHYNAKLDSWARLEAGLPVLGHAHTILKTLSLNPAGRRPAVSHHLGAGEALEWTLRAIARLRQWPLDPPPTTFFETAESLARSLQKLEEPFRGRFPNQLVHGNFWDASVLFRNGKVVLVTGFDDMAELPRVEDLAWTLYSANLAFPDDRLSGRRIRRLRSMVDAYDSGVAEPLTAAERAALPLAMARIPLFMMRDLTLLEQKEDADRPMKETLPELRWATELLDDLPHWQEGFA